MQLFALILYWLVAPVAGEAIPDEAVRAIGGHVPAEGEVGQPFWVYAMSLDDIRRYSQSHEMEPFTFVEFTLVGAPILIRDGGVRGLETHDWHGFWHSGKTTAGASVLYARAHRLQTEGYEVALLKEPINGPFIFARDRDGVLFVSPMKSYAARDLGIKPDEDGEYPLVRFDDVAARFKSVLSERIAWDQLTPTR